MTNIIVDPDEKRVLDLTSIVTFDLQVILFERSTLKVYGAWNLDKQNICGKLKIIHRGRHSTSKVIFKSVLNNQSVVDLDCSIIIEKQSDKSLADLQFRQLVLDNSSNVKTKPNLWIYHDDVKCTHGSATSGISPSHLEYFLSRGLSIIESQKLIVGGFLGEN